jgi:hypothetical protein
MNKQASIFLFVFTFAVVIAGAAFVFLRLYPL